MAKKLYCTKKPVISLGFGLVIPGRKEKTYLSFQGGLVEPQFIPSSIVVEDEKVQEALEATKQFGSKFELVKTFREETVVHGAVPETIVETAPPVDEKKAVKRVGQVKTVQGAITTLIKQGADPDSLDTLEDVTRVAKEMNIEFPNLKV